MFVTAVLLFIWLLHWSELFVCIEVGLKKLRELVERSRRAANWLHAGQRELRGVRCVCSEVVREEEWLWRDRPGFVYLDEMKCSLLLLLLVSTLWATQACMCDSTSSTQWDLQPMKRLWELDICFPAHVNMKAISRRSGTTPFCLCFYFNLQQCFLLLPLSICLLLFLRCHCCHHFQTLHTDRSLHTNVTCLHSALRLPQEVKWNHLKPAGRRMTEPWSRPSARLPNRCWDISDLMRRSHCRRTERRCDYCVQIDARWQRRDNKQLGVWNEPVSTQCYYDLYVQVYFTGSIRQIIFSVSWWKPS